MLQKFLESFAEILDEELTIVIGSENEYEYTTSTVFFNPNNTEDFGFMRHLKEVHNCSFAYDFPLAMWSLLHEIGHHFTIDDCEDDIETRVICSIASDKNDINIQNLYYNIESEWRATEWAINFIKEHSELCNKLVTELR